MQNHTSANVFNLNEKKNHFHITGLALGLALKQRLKVVRKWRIEMDFLTLYQRHRFSYSRIKATGLQKKEKSKAKAFHAYLSVLLDF